MKTLFSTRGVLVEPLPADAGAVKYKMVNGIKTLDVSTGLMPLKVVFATDIPFFTTFITVVPGDQVVVGAKFISGQKWAGEIYQYEGKSVVCVPYEVIFGVVSDEPTVD